MPTNNYNISITNDKQYFYDQFMGEPMVKKHFVSVGLKELKGQEIILEGDKVTEYPDLLKVQDFPYLFNSEISSKYLLSTYQVISREVEAVYLYIPSKIIYDDSLDMIRLQNNKTLKINQFLINHLYTLMTRATMKLNIYCEDASLFNFLKDKIDYINELNLINDEIEDMQLLDEKAIEYEYDIFIAYHGTNNPKGSYKKAKEICDYLKVQGFKVFLNDYSYNEKDEGIGFNETKFIIQRSENFLLVFNDSIYLDEYGMIPNKYIDNKVNQLYSELTMFD